MWSSCNCLLLSSHFNQKWNMLTYFFCKFPIWNFTKTVSGSLAVMCKNIVKYMTTHGKANRHSFFHCLKNHYHIKVCNVFCKSWWLKMTIISKWWFPLTYTHTHFQCHLTFTRRIKSHQPFAGIIKSSPYSARFQDKG